MNDQEFEELVLQCLDSEDCDFWKLVTRHSVETWGPDEHWDWQQDNYQLYDRFIAKAICLSSLDAPESYVDAMLACYDLTLLGVPDEKKKQIKLYEIYYSNIVDGIANSIREAILPAVDHPDADLDPPLVKVELERFEKIQPPTFYPHRPEKSDNCRRSP